MNIQWTAKGFDGVSKRDETENVFHVSGVEETVDHVEDEQRLHSVIRKAFPRLGEGDVTESARVADETAVLRIVHHESKN